MVSTANVSQPEPASRSPWLGLATGIVLLVGLTLLIAEIDNLISTAFLSRGVTRNPLEYPLTAVVIGLLTNGLLRLTGAYEFVRPAIRTELFLKVGLVILGSSISFGTLLSTGAGGLIQALVMVTSVFFFTWWLSGKAGLPHTLRAVMSSAVAVCGVSAAIAAAGSVLARKEEVTYITTLVILTALPLMLLMPIAANALGLSPLIAGAWFGGNIDTTAAVIGAGTMHGPEAQQVAAVVKLAQNVMIGVVAFALALYFAAVVEKDETRRPGPAMIWHRFPKFVLGFLLVSILASTAVFTPALIAEMRTATKWAFALAFLCIGLEFSPMALKEMGWKPVLVYLGATVFNTLLALGVAAVIFGALGLGA